jgi:hypothetical protein
MHRLAKAITQVLTCTFFILGFSPLSPAYDVAGVPRREKLLHLDTPHFAVLYPQPLADTAALVARYAEEAYAILTEVYGYRPESKIDLLLVDSTDTHNGWATPVPHNTILIYAAGSEPGSSIYQPANYLRRTVFHELTHVLTTDMRFGYNKVFSRVFGKVLPFNDPLSYATFLSTASPVLLAPSWYLEGQAIFAETQFAPPGRGRSTYADMVLRTAVRDHNLLPYAKWHLETPHWPYGMGAYLYGMRLIQQVDAQSSRKNPLGDLNESIAHGFLFANSRAARRATGKGFPQLARETLNAEISRQSTQLKVLESHPLTPTLRLTPKEIAAGPSVVIGDTAFFLASEEEEGSRLYRYSRSRKAASRTAGLRTMSYAGSLSAFRQQGQILYTRLNVQDFENLWYEIRRFDPQTGKDSLVTDKGRYREIDISPDGQHIVAVSQRSGTVYLLELTLDSNGKIAEEKTLLNLPAEHDLTSPRYAPDGADISFVEADATGYRLKIINRKNHASRVRVHGTAQIIAPVWHPSGKTLVYSSDLTGVYNLYEAKAEDNTPPIPLTHVTGGLFFPAFCDDGASIVATSYDGFGPHLTEILYPARSARISPPVISPLADAGTQPWIEDLKKRSQTAGQEAVSGVPAKPYNSFSGLRFDYWSPWLTASAKGVQGGVGASFSDPAGFQDIKLLAGRESRYGTFLGGIDYTYKGLAPDIRLYATADQAFYSDLLQQAGTDTRFDHAEEVKQYGVSLEFPLASLDRRFSLSGGYEYKVRQFIDKVADDYRDVSLTVLPSEKDEGLVWTRLTYFDGDSYGRSNSMEDGRLISIGAERADTSLGGGLNRSRYLSAWNEYLPVPNLKNHVLKLSATYGFSDGDRIAQGAFGLGGYGSPVADLAPGIPNTLSLRGYPINFQTGESIAKASAAYRFPLRDFSKGAEGAFPFYSRQLFAEVFYEGGQAWDNPSQGNHEKWINACGLEVNYALKMLRFLAFSPGIGLAYAPDRPDDEDDVQLYLSIKGWVNF